jgi:hypothetical protein
MPSSCAIARSPLTLAGVGHAFDQLAKPDEHAKMMITFA